MSTNKSQIVVCQPNETIAGFEKGYAEKERQ